MEDFLKKIFRITPGYTIDSRESLENAALHFGILPFFRNNIRGLSVEEMALPGLIFGGNFDEGCWEWKGPVVRRKTTAYGKFFRKKAGFVSLDLLPDFLNYRRAAYPIKPESTEELLLDIIRENDALTSTELKRYIFGGYDTRREWNDLPSSDASDLKPVKRKSLEGPLQRLQMGGWIIISDFVYKRTRKGERYGWGVATYSTPEIVFGDNLILPEGKRPEESIEEIIRKVKKAFPAASSKALNLLLK